MIAMMLIVSTRGGYRGRDNRIEDETIVCTPCTCSLSERAGRCSPLRTPCTGLFSDCARIAPPSPLVLASLPRCSLPRLRLAPPAYSCPLHAPPPLHSSRLSHPTAPTSLPRAPRRCSRRRRSPCQPWLSLCPPAPCPCRPHPRHLLPPSPPRPRPLPPGRLLPPQAPSPSRSRPCPHHFAPPVLPLQPHLPPPPCRPPRAPPPPEPHSLSMPPPPPRLPPLTPPLSDQ